MWRSSESSCVSVAEHVRAARPLRVAIVTNIPTPYRIPVYDLLSDVEDFEVRVFYFAEREFNREWVLEPPRAESVVLPSSTLHWRGRDIHFSRGVWQQLSRFRADVVVTNGFNPALLVAFAWAVVHRAAHVAQTDGTPDLERRLGPAHRLARRIVSRRSAATVAAAHAGLDLLVRWGADPATRHLSPLAVDNEAFSADPAAGRDIDVLFSGRLDRRKDPMFVLRTARAAAERLDRRLAVVLLGDGPERDALAAYGRQHADRIDLTLAGFLQQDALPAWFRRAKTFVFPSHEDAWGLVVNEAAAASVPQIVAPTAGAKELVVDGVTGFVLPHQEPLWAEALVGMLQDEPARAAMGAAAAERVSAFSYQAAASGLEDAVRMAVAR